MLFSAILKEILDLAGSEKEKKALILPSNWKSNKTYHLHPNEILSLTTEPGRVGMVAIKNPPPITLKSPEANS